MLTTCATCTHFFPEGTIYQTKYYRFTRIRAQCGAPMPFAKSIGTEVPPVATWEDCPCWKGEDG